MRKNIENVISDILREFAEELKIAYAVIYRPFRNGPYVLVVRFKRDSTPDERFRLRLDLVTILPSFTNLDVYDYNSIPKDVACLILRYGKAVFIYDYEQYMQDLEEALREVRRIT